MKPEWEKTATLLKKEDASFWKVGRVDGICERPLLSDFGITGFPTIFMYVHHVMPMVLIVHLRFEKGEETKYQLPQRKALAFISWIKETSALFANQQRFEV